MITNRLPLIGAILLLGSAMFSVSKVPGAPAAGESAPADSVAAFSMQEWLLVPLRVHLLSAKQAPQIHTTLTEADITRILAKINGVWAQAGITFWLESLVREAAANPGYGARLGVPGDLPGLLQLRPRATLATNVFHLYYVKQMTANGVYLGEAMFVKDTPVLRPVPGGIDEPIPRVSSHELGHALSLPHHTNRHHLMASRTTGTNLEAAEIRLARAAARKLDWIEDAATVLKRADSLRRDGRRVESRKLSARLGSIPFAFPELQRVLR